MAFVPQFELRLQELFPITRFHALLATSITILTLEVLSTFVKREFLCVGYIILLFCGVLVRIFIQLQKMPSNTEE